MRKKIIVSWLYLLFFLLFEIGVFFLWLPFDTTAENYVASVIIFSFIVVALPIFSNDYFFCSVLTQNEIFFKHKYTGKKQGVQVGSINRFVVDVASIDKPTQSWLIVYANQQKGQILGVGNAALLALLKSYPHIRVVIKKITLQLSRRVAKYLVKHKRTTRHQCEELCEYYHLPKSLLEQSESENN